MTLFTYATEGRPQAAIAASWPLVASASISKCKSTIGHDLAVGDRAIRPPVLPGRCLRDMSWNGCVKIESALGDDHGNARAKGKSFEKLFVIVT